MEEVRGSIPRSGRFFCLGCEHEQALFIALPIKDPGTLDLPSPLQHSRTPHTHASLPRANLFAAQHVLSRQRISTGALSRRLYPSFPHPSYPSSPNSVLMRSPYLLIIFALPEAAPFVTSPHPHFVHRRNKIDHFPSSTKHTRSNQGPLRRPSCTALHPPPPGPCSPVLRLPPLLSTSASSSSTRLFSTTNPSPSPAEPPSPIPPLR